MSEYNEEVVKDSDDHETIVYTVIVGPDKVVRIYKTTIDGDLVEAHSHQGDTPLLTLVGSMIEDYLAPDKYKGTTQLGTLTL